MIKASWVAGTDALCAMIPGVEYMPVPRCDQCLFWERNTLGNVVSRGECVLTSGCDGDGNRAAHPESKALAVVGGDEFGVPVLETSESFGCVQWEAK